MNFEEKRGRKEAISVKFNDEWEGRSWGEGTSKLAANILYTHAKKCFPKNPVYGNKFRTGVSW